LNPDGSKISKRCGAVGDLLAGGSAVVWKALRWLGQQVPAVLQGAPPGELLAWGVAAFEVGAIPPRLEKAVDSKSKNR
jgi:glutamyl-Q tRNA(Asp) synthetase